MYAYYYYYGATGIKLKLSLCIIPPHYNTDEYNTKLYMTVCHAYVHLPYNDGLLCGMECVVTYVHVVCEEVYSKSGAGEMDSHPHIDNGQRLHNHGAETT